MSAPYRLSFLALLSVCCRAQTVTPLVVLADSTPHCQGRAITFRVQQPQGLSNFVWQVTPARETVTSLSADSSELTVTFGLPITYSVSVSAFDGAPRSGLRVVSISRKATAAFNASLMTQGYPNELYLTNYSENYLDVTWRFSDGSVTTTPDLSRTYAGSGAHSVDLVARGPNGCSDTAHYDFFISDSSGITLPNVFTPNLDGVNDVYRPIARGILHLSARIYNREQHMLYKWDRVNGFWDGYTTGGQPCPDGVYSIVLDAIGFDNKKYKLKAFITLIR